MAKRLVLLSPNPLGDYAICTAELLARQGFSLAAIYVRRLASGGRLVQELRREGLRPFAGKVYRKLLHRSVGAGSSEFETLADFKQRKGISIATLKALARQRGAEYRPCGDFNEPQVCAEVASMRPDVVIFTGGGLVRQPLIDAAQGRIVACHPGFLPQYRGMDCLEWAILEGRLDRLGVSTFLFDAGVDTGAILRVHPVEPTSHDRNFDTLRQRIEPAICEALVESVKGLLDGTLEPARQRAEDGRQFFTMHPRLKGLANEALQRAGQDK